MFFLQKLIFLMINHLEIMKYIDLQGKIQLLHRIFRVFLRFTMVFEVYGGSGAEFLEVRDVKFLDGGPCKLGVL